MSVLGIQSRSIRLLGLSAASAVLVVACGGSGSSPTAVPPTIGPSTAATPATSAGTGALTIGSGTTSAGTVLTGNGGMTLYITKKDTAPNTSTCTDACATNWPAATVDAGGTPTAGSGVTGTLATFMRTDGTTQVSYNGAPLYYFAGDSAAGDANGQGKGGVWFAATPTGASGGSPAPTTGAASPPPSGAPVYTIGLGSGSAGTYLTDSNGNSLYVYKKDSQGKSACTSSNCTTNWPPLTVDGGGAVAGDTGVTGTFATFPRPDGKMQVTWNGAPLYSFAGDSKSGDTNGVGVSPDWSLAAPKARPGY